MRFGGFKQKVYMSNRKNKKMSRFQLKNKEVLFKTATEKYVPAKEIVFTNDKIIVVQLFGSKDFSYGTIGICHEEDDTEEFTTVLESEKDFLDFREKSSSL